MDLYDRLMEMVITEDTTEEYIERRSLLEGKGFDDFVKRQAYNSMRVYHNQQALKNALKGSKGSKKIYLSMNNIYEVCGLLTPLMTKTMKEFNTHCSANFSHDHLSKGNKIPGVVAFTFNDTNPEIKKYIDSGINSIKIPDKFNVSKVYCNILNDKNLIVVNIDFKSNTFLK